VIVSDKSHICPMLVGRGAQKQLLDTLIERTDGPAIPKPIVLISGEAGIGKSRLVGESKVFAENKGFTILSGRCFEPDRVLPYASLVDLLKNYCASRSNEEIQHRLGLVSSELVRIFPGLNKYFAAINPLQATSPDQEKRRLLDSLTEFFLDFSEPVFIAIDDLHWSDEASLEFLLHFVRKIENHPILLMITYRNEAIHPELAQFLTTLNRERRDLIEMPLTRVSMTEVDEMIRAVLKLSRATRANFLETIYHLTEGNPFFIEEVLKSVTTAEEVLNIPQSLQLVVKQRTDSLSPAARNLLSLAAIAGRRFDFSLLQKLTGQSESGLITLIKELINAQLVVEESFETFAFRHALTRETVYKELLARERKVWHRAIADAVEQIDSSDANSHFADLAYHFYEAGSWAKALDYSQRAGKQAQDLYAPRAAIEHFSRAIESAGHLTTTASADLYRERGQAYEIIGDFEAAIDDHEKALQIARASSNRRAIWQSLMDLGMAWASREYARSGNYFQEALELARKLDDPATLAHSLNRMANWLTNMERAVESITLHKEALLIFQQINDQQGMAITLDNPGYPRHHVCLPGKY
jgi:predicted ATPase